VDAGWRDYIRILSTNIDTRKDRRSRTDGNVRTVEVKVQAPSSLHGERVGKFTEGTQVLDGLRIIEVNDDEASPDPVRMPRLLLASISTKLESGNRARVASFNPWRVRDVSLVSCMFPTHTSNDQSLLMLWSGITGQPRFE